MPQKVDVTSRLPETHADGGVDTLLDDGTLDDSQWGRGDGGAPLGEGPPSADSTRPSAVDGGMEAWPKSGCAG